MTEPWFNPNLYGWVPGTVFGVSCGLVGVIAGAMAPRGKARTLVLGLCGLLIAAALSFLVAGLVAWQSGQPYGIWYALLLPGAIGVMVLGPNVPMLYKVYRAAEERRMAARDLIP